MRCPNSEYAEKMIAAIDAVRVRGDSVGGVVTCIVRNVPRVRLLSFLNVFVHVHLETRSYIYLQNLGSVKAQ